jgi:phage-related protein
MTWNVELLDRRVEKELESLPKSLRNRFLHIAEMLEEFGPEGVGMPHVRPLEGKLYEIRMKGPEGIGRAVYVSVRERRLVVVHAFRKKTQKTPKQALELARERSKEIDDG